MNYFLRPVEAADFDFLFRLKVACLKEYVTAVWGWDEAFQRSHFSANFNRIDSHIVVVYGRDVGQLAVQYQPSADHLNGIYILPAYQGQGLGSQVVGDVLAQAQAENRRVQLQVIIGNPARRLYERLGFRLIRKTGTHYIMRYG